MQYLPLHLVGLSSFKTTSKCMKFCLQMNKKGRLVASYILNFPWCPSSHPCGTAVGPPCLSISDRRIWRTETRAWKWRNILSLYINIIWESWWWIFFLNLNFLEAASIYLRRKESGGEGRDNHSRSELYKLKFFIEHRPSLLNISHRNIFRTSKFETCWIEPNYIRALAFLSRHN